MTTIDAYSSRLALRADGLLRMFNEAGVLAAADVHVALRLRALLGEEDEAVLLAAALAVRAPRVGHLLVDLRTIAGTATSDLDEAVDLEALPWPEPDIWLAAVAASPLVSADVAPLRLEGSALYLDRYRDEEVGTARDLLALAAADAPQVDEERLRSGLARLFPGDVGGRQPLAAAAAVLSRLALIAGGPGTGKTTTVARVLALLLEQDGPRPIIALAAPTGKAAARLQEAVHEAARDMPVSAEVREALLALEATTLHRLLGRRPGSQSRFKHDRANRLSHDIVVVDETSMVSSSLMARLVEAVRPDARLVLVGDPGQLASVEAGAVLGDLVGPASDRLRMSVAGRTRLEGVTGAAVKAEEADEGVRIGDGIVVLDRVHRYGGGIGAVAEAVRRGDADTAVNALRGGDDVLWIEGDAAVDAPLDVLRAEALATFGAVQDAAAAGDAAAALRALGGFRLLCAHRRGDHGVAAWVTQMEAWLARGLSGFAPRTRWYVGRPLLVTRNDAELRLANGDTGVVIAAGDRVRAAFERRGEVITIAPSRLEAVETPYAMTIHKAQGSQVRTAAVVLPDAGSRILTRELLYTAVTRAQERLIVVGTEEVVRAAVEQPVARASGLRDRLWRAP